MFNSRPKNKTIKARAFQIIFGTETKAGKLFDIILLWVILLSVLTVLVESIPNISEAYNNFFIAIEWVFTIIFSLEFIIRIWSSPRPLRYIFSFWGIIDFCSILPTYLDLLLSGYHYLLIVRIFRLLRVFRILKLVRFTKEAQLLVQALRSSFHKISIFLVAVMSIVVMLGTLMYVVEGGAKGFTSIPQGIYWAIVTVTTVGYGDIVPQTVLGKILSSIAMIIGYAIIAVPTGIVTIHLSQNAPKNKILLCQKCSQKLQSGALYCQRCGAKQKITP